MSDPTGGGGPGSQRPPRGESRRAWLGKSRLASVLALGSGQLAIVVAVLLVWELSSGRLISPFWISSPSAIADVLTVWVIDGSLWKHLQATLTVTGAGWALGALAGVASGVALGLLPLVERVVSPFLIALYSLPKIALAPLFVIVFGIGIESKIVLVAVIVYFLLLYNTLDGIRDIEAELVESLQVMGATSAEIASRVMIPGATPWIFTGLRVSVRYAFTAAILGELVAGNEGIGFLIEFSAGQFDSAGVFAAVFVLVLCSVLLTELLTRTETSALRWRI